MGKWFWNCEFSIRNFNIAWIYFSKTYKLAFRDYIPIFWNRNERQCSCSRNKRPEKNYGRRDIRKVNSVNIVIKWQLMVWSYMRLLCKELVSCNRLHMIGWGIYCSGVPSWAHLTVWIQLTYMQNGKRKSNSQTSSISISIRLTKVGNQLWPLCCKMKATLEENQSQKNGKNQGEARQQGTRATQVQEHLKRKAPLALANDALPSPVTFKLSSASLSLKLKVLAQS